jgi:hypothetical protein
MRRNTIPMLLALATVCTPLAAQSELPITTGDRIRVSVPDAYRAPVVGTLVARAPDVLTVARTRQGVADTVNIPMALVRSVEVSRGRLSGGQGVRRGLVRGLAAGAMVGAALGGIQSMGIDEREGNDVSEVGEAAKMAAQFGAIGLVAGGLFGMRERERWERLSLPTVNVGAGAQPGSVALSLKW